MARSLAEVSVAAVGRQKSPSKSPGADVVRLPKIGVEFPRKLQAKSTMRNRKRAATSEQTSSLREEFRLFIPSSDTRQ